MARNGTRKVPVAVLESGKVVAMAPSPFAGFTRVMCSTVHGTTVMLDCPVEAVAKIRVGNQVSIRCQFQTTGNARTGKESDGRG